MCSCTQTEGSDALCCPLSRGASANLCRCAEIVRSVSLRRTIFPAVPIYHFLQGPVTWSPLIASGVWWDSFHLLAVPILESTYASTDLA